MCGVSAAASARCAEGSGAPQEKGFNPKCENTPIVKLACFPPGHGRMRLRNGLHHGAAQAAAALGPAFDRQHGVGKGDNNLQLKLFK